MKQLTFDDAVVLVSVRMPMKLKNEIIKMAEVNDYSLNRQIVDILRDSVEVE
jgi:predicted HicB family RNase H-like nuclease